MSLFAFNMRDYCQRWEQYLMRAARVIDDSNS